MGTVMSSVISCLCEITALMPVNTPVMEFPGHFLDRGVGLTVGQMYWLARTVAAADQLVAVSRTVEFQYDNGKMYLDWNIAEYDDSAQYSQSLFLIRNPGTEIGAMPGLLAIVWDMTNWNELGFHIPNVSCIH